MRVWLGRFVSPGWLLGLFGLYGLLYYLMTASSLPFSAQQLSAIPLDLQFNYSPSQALQTLTQLGPEGRQHYLQFLALDIAFPLVSALFFAGLFYAVWGQNHGWLGGIFWLPIARSALDYLENLTLVSSILRFPDIPSILLSTANLLTLFKNGLGFATFLLAAIALGVSLYRNFRRPKGAAL